MSNRPMISFVYKPKSGGDSMGCMNCWGNVDDNGVVRINPQIFHETVDGKYPKMKTITALEAHEKGEGYLNVYFSDDVLEALEKGGYEFPTNRR